MKTLLYLGLAILAMKSPIRGEDASGGGASPAKRLTGEGLIALTLKDTDGRLQILFSTGRSGRNGLWVMNADGSGQRRVSEIDAAPFPGRASRQSVKDGGL